MPTVFTHGLVGLGVAAVAAPKPMPWPYYALAAALSMAPDLDVVAFSFGIPYGSRFGHRGFSHSIFLAALVGLAAAGATTSLLETSFWRLFAVFFVSMGSHGILDMCTNGGMGIAVLAPFDDRRYFFPWQPVQVSMIGLGFFSRWGVRALLSEVVWIWLPLAVVVGSVFLYRHGNRT